MSRPKLQNDCFVSDRPRLKHDEALAILASRVAPMAAVETVPLAAVCGRILAVPVIAQHPVPAHTNSAVDGYAISHADYVANPGRALPVAGRAAAGHPFRGALIPGSAVRIFTGAVMPVGLDTAVMQEDVVQPEGRSASVEPAEVIIPVGLRKGANVRLAGEDVAQGTVLLPEGAVLRPQDLAALASVGFAEVQVFERLRVAIVSSGDEVIRAGSRPLALGDVYDANVPMLTALVALAGADVVDLGVWPDSRPEVEARLADAARAFDVILTTGGASKGAEDHMGAALDALGRRHLWQLAIKPGRPMMFGQIGQGARETVIIGLPGNPVAVFVCFLMYVFPLLRRLAGAPWSEPRRFILPAAFDFKGRKPGRREFWRGMIETGPDGRMTAQKFKRDGSGLISSLRAADVLIDIPEDTADVHRGDPVALIPFSEFGILAR